MAARVAATRDELGAHAQAPLPDGVVADLSSLVAVRAMAAEIAAAHPVLDVLIHNAGVFAKAPIRSADGHELSIAVNHLAPFALTQGLLSSASTAGRVVTVSSIAHSRGQVDLERLKARALPAHFDGYTLYAESKLMNVLFANELARRLKGTRVTSNSLHPGVVSTKLLKEGFGMAGPDSHERGAATSVFLAVDDSQAHAPDEGAALGAFVAPSRSDGP